MRHEAPGRSLVIQTAPATTPVSLIEAKAQTRTEEFSDDDALLTRLISVATDQLDPSGHGWLGAALISQQWNLYLDGFPCARWDEWGSSRWYASRFDRNQNSIEIPFPPLITVDFIKYYDTNAVLQTLASTEYQIEGTGAWKKARIWPKPNGSWPSTQVDRRGAVQVQFTCGHATAAAIPASAKHAILLMIGHYYENREQVLADPTGRATAIEIPQGVQNLLAPLRIYL